MTEALLATPATARQPPRTALAATLFPALVLGLGTALRLHGLGSYGNMDTAPARPR